MWPQRLGKNQEKSEKNTNTTLEWDRPWMNVKESENDHYRSKISGKDVLTALYSTLPLDVAHLGAVCNTLPLKPASL